MAAMSILLFLTACSSNKIVSGKMQGGSESLYKYQWNLTDLGSQVLSNSSDNLPKLLFFFGKINSVSGSTGCNKLKGSFELSNTNLIKFSPLAITKMTCGGYNVEAEFLTALAKVDNWSIAGDQLLLNNGNDLLMKFKGITVETAKLNGDWELNYISGPRIAFDGLYPDKKPTIKFNLPANELGGNTTCNGFSSKIIINGNQITVAEPFAKPMVFCEGGGETTFLNMLKKVNKYVKQMKIRLHF